MLIGLAAKFEPEKFRDKYREQVQTLIAAKIQGREVVVSSESQPAPAAPVVDILDELKKSLAATRKPVGRVDLCGASTDAFFLGERLRITLTMQLGYLACSGTPCYVLREQWYSRPVKLLGTEPASA